MITLTIHFKDQCLEAIRFYQEVFPVENLHYALYSQGPEGSVYRNMPGAENLVMHSEMSIYGIRMTLCDTCKDMVLGNAVQLSVFLPSTEEIQRIYDKLTVGGEVVTALKPEFFSPLYGEVRDPFGITWQLVAGG